MISKVRRRGRGLRAAVWLCAAGASAALSAQEVPEELEAASTQGGAPWNVDVFYENDTRYRGEDVAGEDIGLSKFRNTLQLEADKELGGWELTGVLRVSYDGVYRLNDDEYGDKAGGPVQLGNSAAPIFQFLGAPFLNTPTVPYGGGINNAIATGLGLPPSNLLGFNSTDPTAPRYSPNEGLRVLGDRWNRAPGTTFAVPVRPCDRDPRGCVDFGGYGDLDKSDLEWSEINSRLDFIRELYVKRSFPLADGKNLFLKVGRQQVVWGRTDLFRVLDVINPVDLSRNNIYDELEDIRIPMWILQAEYRRGPTPRFQDSNLQLVWNFDKFRPNNLGQCGTANVALDAGCFFRSMKMLWDYGGTVANFAPVPPGGVPAGQPALFAATDFGPGQEGIRNVHLPAWTLSNTQIGAKFEAVTPGGIAFSLNALNYRSQLPSLRGFSHVPQINMFTGATQLTTHNLAFDLVYPRVTLLGGSMDFQAFDATAAVRLEAAYTDGEEFANTLRPNLFSEHNVFRSVIGIDRPTIIPLISKTRTTLISGQLFYQHIFDHETEERPYGRVGNADWENNVIATLLVRASLANDRINPQVIMARDFQAHAMAIAPSLEWVVSDQFKIVVGANFKEVDGKERWNYDDGRSVNPYPPFTTFAGAGQPFTPGSWGLGSIEPLGRFRAGPIGAAWREDELFMTLRFSF